ncbi:Kae1-associated serine/threonine protein kinase [Candidatus Micrarchaeota archaeon]|nr:Kae1-associated serine/threonine protein kinase [Candidatus Micrarchaeota archaeon]MBU1682140.1 Kae1-associated serine/threonine protein kinase [Candidatus Micrarchaeota archaeon]
MRGAEAVLSKTEIIGNNAIVKNRIAKSYRLKEIDEKLRRERTRSEARLLHKAKLAGVKCPTVLQVEEFEIVMSFLDGKRPDMDAEECREAGRILARLHKADIIHGDYTPANIIKKGGSKGTADSFYVIDFGLGFISADIEDKAVDVFTMLRAISEKDAFIDGYKTYSKAESVLKRVAKVEKRVRYAI